MPVAEVATLTSVKIGGGGELEQPSLISYTSHHPRKLAPYLLRRVGTIMQHVVERGRLGRTETPHNQERNTSLGIIPCSCAPSHLPHFTFWMLPSINSTQYDQSLGIRGIVIQNT